MRKTFSFVTLLTVVLFFVAPALARAEGEITIGASEHENRFPAEIRFSVEAQSASQITKVTFRYKIVGNPATGSANASFTPGTDVRAEYVWNTQRQYIPPGVELQYYWQIEDAAGQRAQSQPATLTVEDTRFRWQSVSADRLTLFWYQGDKRFAQDLLDAGTRAVKQLSDEVGVGLDKPVKIFVYQTQRDLLGALPPRGVEWTGGEAFPDLGIIVLTAPPTSSGRDYGLRTVPHELSHVIVQAATDNPFGGVPRWLDEGLATYAEGKLLPQYEEALQSAVAKDSLLTLRSLSGNFPTDQDESLLGYAESYSMVNYLIGKYGRDKMSQLLGIFRDGSTQDDALRQVYGRDAASLEADWRASIGAAGLSVAPAATPEVAPAVTPQARATATAPATPTATPVPAQAPSSGRSCFGGILSVGGALGGLLLLAARQRG